MIGARVRVRRMTSSHLIDSGLDTRIVRQEGACDQGEGCLETIRRVWTRLTYGG